MPVTTQKLDKSCYLYLEETSTVKYVDMKDAATDGKNFVIPAEYENAFFVTDGQNSVFDGQKVKVLEN